MAAGHNRLFETYIVVDWSAKSQPSPRKPSKDAIWVAERSPRAEFGGKNQAEQYFRTRSECKTYLLDRLKHYTKQGDRVFVGFDFAFGYPLGFVEVLGLVGPLPAWRLLWGALSKLIEDGENNSNNRFEVASELNKRSGGREVGPFWGCPAERSYRRLTAKGPPSGFPYQVNSNLSLDNFRWTEKQTPGVQLVWKLFGNGSVGSQSLLGIPVVNSLRFNKELEGISKVWPFETGFTPNPIGRSGPSILYVEIWPGVVGETLDGRLVRDQAQVRGFVDWLHRLDANGQLSRLFDKPKDILPDQKKAAVTEEGWIIRPVVE